jgi:hypothetical protein
VRESPDGHDVARSSCRWRDGRFVAGASRRRTPTVEGVKRRAVRASGEDRESEGRNDRSCRLFARHHERYEGHKADQRGMIGSERLPAVVADARLATRMSDYASTSSVSSSRSA